QAFETVPTTDLPIANAGFSCSASEPIGGRYARQGAPIPNEAFVAARVRLEGKDRLQLQELVAEDGTQATLGLWDRDRQVACAILETSSGERCVDSEGVGDWSGPSTDQSGLDCSAYVALDQCTPGTMGWVAVGEAAEDGTSAYTIYELDDAPAASEVSTELGECIADANDMVDGRWPEAPTRVALFGATIPDDALAAPLRDELTEQRIRSFVHTSAIGDVRLPVSKNDLFDAAFGIACSITPTGDGKTRCVPHGVNSVFLISAGPTVLYADDLCADSLAPAALVERTLAAEEAGLRLPFVSSYTAEGQQLLRRLGEPFDDQPFRKEDGVCTPALDVDATELFRLGEEVSPEEFVEYRPTLR
ncbi:MAG TPA: hypothetical protein VLC09_05380, partial [Polyangiaceae bacterium]|nr:hypothetical protein [Polyangiaceae bacterium]